jgi:tetratricopeptide (TPR) repeat protein
VSRRNSRAAKARRREAKSARRGRSTGGDSGGSPASEPATRTSMATVEASARSAADAERLSTVGLRAFIEYQQAGHLELLEHAVTALQGAMLSMRPSHPDLAVTLSNLAAALVARFERLGGEADLDAAIDIGKRALAATPPSDPEVAATLSNLGGSLRRRFERAGDSADLDAAIDVGKRAVAITRPRHPNLAGRLSNLGGSLHARFELAGDSADLDAAIDARKRAVAATPPGRSADLAADLSNLGGSLHARFELAGDSADLDAAIDARKRAVAATPPGRSSDLAAHLSDLATSLHARFELAGDSADLDAAVDLDRQAVDLIPPGHHNLAIHLSSLGSSLTRRFQRTGNQSDLDEAIDVCQQAVAIKPPDDFHRATTLSNLGGSLFTRFERLGNSADLDAAIDAVRQAVDLTPPGHSYLAVWLQGLGSVLFTRFEYAGDRADLDAAIDSARQAVAATPPGHTSLAGRLANLAASLVRRFEQVGDHSDLDAAIDASRQAVAMSASGQPNRPVSLSTLATSLLARFEQLHNPADLDAAIDAAQQAVAGIPPGQPDLGTRISTLAASLNARFEQTDDPVDLNSAIDVGRQAVTASPSDHPHRATVISNLGALLFTRFLQADDGADLDAAIDCWQQATQSPTGAPSARLAAAQRWGAAAAGAKRSDEAFEGYAAAIGLLPTVAWHGLDRATREEQLAQWSGLAANAAACAILAARPKLAVELLEQGRSILWAQALNLRSDLARLAQKAPHQAERLESIRKILDTALPDAMQASAEQAGRGTFAHSGYGQQRDAAELRRRMAREWDEVLAEVRALEGFEHFLAATPYAELAAAAVRGPVVVVNASRRGCHALTMAPGTSAPQVIDLPGMTMHAAVENANAMLLALASAISLGRGFRDREKSRHAILDVLGWLWDVLAEPVLAALGHTGPPQAGERWPRVWWCPTGPLTVLPIHAAGYYPRHRTTTAGIQTVLDRVISSYTPTLTALTRAYRPSQPAQIRQMAVGMPTTPGLPPLPAVRAELEVLARHFPPTAGNHQLVESQATRADVAAAIAGHSWVHLACHAGQAHADPARSGFALWDGILSITDLAAQPTQHRDLAFLSACQTATGSVRHLDEAIHLAAAMQFLGYRHVIATMWTIADSPAPHIADSVYTTLTTGGIAGPDRAAEALHRAVHSLRHIDPTDPLLWAPYIHLGP